MTEKIPFAERVWRTLSGVDVTNYLKTKGRFSYLPWADAWALLMDKFPESHFEFDEPKMYDNGSGEQWVTLTIVDRDEQLVRKWWLPYLDHNNKPLQNPTSLQINNTRMRVLVKCIAVTTGLGVYVFAGEDVPDETHDGRLVSGAPKPRSKGVSGTVMEDIALSEEQWSVVNELAAKFREAKPDKDTYDAEAFVNHFHAFQELTSEEKIALGNQLPSYIRSQIKSVSKAVREAATAEALGDAQE